MIVALIAIGIVILGLSIFVTLYVLNRKTPVPDDCPKEELAEGCGACMLSCSSRESKFDVKNLLKEKEEPVDETLESNELDNDKEEEK